MDMVFVPFDSPLGEVARLALKQFCSGNRPPKIHLGTGPISLGGAATLSTELTPLIGMEANL